MDQKEIKKHYIQCYHCNNKFERHEIQRLRQGDLLVCNKCRHQLNRKTVKLKKRREKKCPQD